MDDRRPHFAAPLLAVALVMLLLAIYFGAFYLLGSIGTVGPTRFHVYQSPWLSYVFEPAARVESWLLGCEVYTAHSVDP